MTGYGKAEAIVGNRKVTVEVKSLNSKFFDCNLRIPGLYREKEMEIRSLAAKSIGRGKVDVGINYDTLEGEQNFFVNKALVKNYYDSMIELSEEIHLTNKDKVDFLATVMRLPDVMKSEKPRLTDEEWSNVNNLLVQALSNFNEFRIEEGKSLNNELSERINNIQTLLEKVPQYEEERVLAVKTRIKKNLEDIISKEGFDQNRLEQEMIFYLEKLDVTEEKVRLKAHCEHFTNTSNDENIQGKKLGFITQEIGREINTLGSKANHAEMQKIVVQMKDELEKIKEQTLNVL